MKKFLIIAMVLLLSILVLYSITKDKPKTLIVPISDKTALFLSGSKEHIREYLEAPNHKITLMDYYYLIDGDRSNIIEMILRDYNHNPNYPEYKGGSSLTYAAKEQKKGIVEILIKYGADVNYIDEYGNSALIFASYIDKIVAPNEKYTSRVITKLLIEAGAKIDFVAEFGETALRGAIIADDLKRIKYLVDNGADINHLDKSKSGYIFYCNVLSCVEYFVSKGLSINSVDKNNRNLIKSAVSGRFEKTTEVKKLINLGADICHKDNEGLNVLNYIEVAGINPHKKTENPDFYNKEVEKNKNKEHYRYLKKEYNKWCVETLDSGNG
jgi:predicted Fe-Mo cluster-binding NifX family protein